LEWQKGVKMADFYEKSPKTLWRGYGMGFIEVPTNYHLDQSRNIL